MTYIEVVQRILDNPTKESLFCAEGEWENVYIMCRMLFGTVLNFEVIKYRKEEICTNPGIPARGGCWHVYPSYKKVENKKPYSTIVVDPHKENLQTVVHNAAFVEQYKHGYSKQIWDYRIMQLEFEEL